MRRTLSLYSGLSVSLLCLFGKHECRFVRHLASLSEHSRCNRDSYTPAAFADTHSPQKHSADASEMTIFVATEESGEIVGTIACLWSRQAGRRPHSRNGDTSQCAGHRCAADC